MKKLYTVMAIIIIAMLVLAACAPLPQLLHKHLPRNSKSVLSPTLVSLRINPSTRLPMKARRLPLRAMGADFDVIVTQNVSDYKQNIQTFIDQGFNTIVTVGFLIGSDTAAAAKANPNVKFIGVDQGICVDETGASDPTFACKGDAAKLLPNYQGIVFAEEQPGYLAGILAASISKSGVIGSVAGTKVPAVVAYIAGYEAGAKSVNPDIKLLTQEVNPDPSKGFNDPATGKAIAQQFIAQGADVLFQVAGLTGQGVLEAACDANVYGIGVDVDQAQTLPNLSKCIVTSAEKKLKDTVQAVTDDLRWK